MRSYRAWLRLAVFAWLGGVALIAVLGGAGALWWAAHRGDEGRAGADWYEAGMEHHRAGDYGEAIAAFERSLEAGFRPDASAYNIACGHALLGERDAAFGWLLAARSLGFELGSYLDSDDDLDALRTDPRMKALRWASRAARPASWQTSWRWGWNHERPREHRVTVDFALPRAAP